MSAAVTRGPMMPALTIWQPWATLIVEGVKPHEFRFWAAPRCHWGRRIAIHAGARPVRKAEIGDLILRLRAPDGARSTGLAPVERALDLLERFHVAPLALPLASVLGTAVLGKPVTARALAGRDDRRRHDAIDSRLWAWPLREIERCAPPIPARGKQGIWMFNERAAA